MIRVRDICYVAALLEAEGTFSEYEGCLTIKIGMTDFDIIERIRNIINPEGMISKTVTNKGSKDFFVTRVSGYRAASWMMTLYTLMGERRQIKIRECLQAWKNQDLSGMIRRHEKGDRCRKGHLIIGLNAFPTALGNHICRVCRTGNKRNRDIAVRNRILVYLKTKEIELCL